MRGYLPSSSPTSGRLSLISIGALNDTRARLAVACRSCILDPRLVVPALLGRFRCARQVERGVDERDVREGLREVSRQAPLARIVFFCKQADVVGEAEQALEQRARFVAAAE